MQCDGNLVLLHPGNRPVWSSGTAGQPDAVASMQTDGNLVVYSHGHVARWSSGTGGNRGAVLAVQDDGNAVIVAPGNRPVWSTRTVIGSTPSGNGQQSLTSRVVDLTNAERARAGCRPLRIDGNLTTAAQRHAQDMAVKNYFSHTAPSAPRTMVDRLRAANVGYRTAAENIATGAVNDPADVVRRWMDSSGHRKNILNCSLGRIGVGYDSRSGGRWVQDFAD